MITDKFAEIEKYSVSQIAITETPDIDYTLQSHENRNGIKQFFTNKMTISDKDKFVDNRVAE